MKLADIVNVLDAKLLAGEQHLDREFEICRGSDLMSDILAYFADGGVVLTGLPTLQAVRTAAVSGVGGLVFVRGKQPSGDVVALARKEEIPLMMTSLSMFVACGRLYSSGMAGHNGER
ncbi:DRTGG domain-containing protein [Desulfoluna spongiiphila]|uniref:DRTGG domain-containing protein n=1 Tax=Desulfoluna spongiiphila TaxID=419481 RepID=A0A1G5E4Y7_9BACT|nr:DRTGG domain-containing protein [Desulfoluna spongiiphila]SCY21568.1 DRTGG domain-containing protein [Desulfoluna spongiiphila]VVS91575.1 drtgg [Desulfoluna spongiiphila]